MAAAGDEGDCLQEEIELLEAIYIHELTIEGPKHRPSSVTLLLHPSTGDENDKQYVCLTLVIDLPHKYPNELPSIQIKNPRGLSEAHIESISDNLRELAESHVGSAMLYQITDYAKESLTDNNIPSCPCAICLSHFQDYHCFTKTECYHYYHSYCLLRYIEYQLRKARDHETDDKQIVCPMCRLPITYDLEALKSSPDVDSTEEQVAYHADAKMKRLQKKLARLYDRQFRKGGIINVAEEKTRCLINTNEVPESKDSATVASGSQINNDLPSSPGKPNVVDNKPIQEKENKQRFERPPSSRKNRGRGGHRHGSDGRWNDRNGGRWNDGRWSDERWNDRPKSSERTKEFHKGAPRNKSPYNSTLGQASNNEKQDEKGVKPKDDHSTRVENDGISQVKTDRLKDVKSSGPHPGMTSQPSTTPVKTQRNDIKNSPARRRKEELVAVADNKRTDSAKGKKYEEKIKTENSTENIDTNEATSELKDKSRDVSRKSREGHFPLETKRKDSDSVRSGDQSSSSKLKDKSRDVSRKSRDSYPSLETKPARKDFDSSHRDKGRKHRRDDGDNQYRNKTDKVVDKKNTKSTQPNMRDSHKRTFSDKSDHSLPSKSHGSSSVVRPPPGFDKVENGLGGSKPAPPPGFEGKELSIPKPPGF